jgi:hypothetical protein
MSSSPHGFGLALYGLRVHEAQDKLLLAAGVVQVSMDEAQECRVLRMCWCFCASSRHGAGIYGRGTGMQGALSVSA